MLAHDWASPSRYPGLTLPPTERAFRGALVYGIWPTLTLDSLVEIASEYRDAHFILDYRGRAEDFIIPVVERFLARAPEALDRLIPQIMLQTQLRPVLKAYPFSSIIYTLYASPDSDDEVIRFVEAHDIGVVVMNSERADSAFVSALSLNGVSVFVHTVNDASAAARFERMGARGVMTDFLPPDSLCD